MASIIIDEIVPTTWRLRLRGADGQTREVDYKAGTPLRLDAAASPTEARPRDGAQPKDRREKPPAGAEKSRTDTKRADERVTTTKPASDTTAANPAEKSEPQKPQQARRRRHEAGPGPGDLVWEETEDDGVTGVRATFARGAFKILHAGGETYGLFYEWNSGKYQTLTCGTLEVLKQEAAKWTADGKLRAPRSNLAAEAAKIACAQKDDAPAAPSPATESPPPAAPPVDPEKDKLLMQGFEATVERLMNKKGAP
jgi:hypothetical protein